MKRALMSYGMPQGHWEQIYSECRAYADAYNDFEESVVNGN